MKQAQPNSTDFRCIAGERLIKLPDVIFKVGLSRSSIYKLLATDSFPKRRYLGGANVVWVESEVDAWIQQQLSKLTPPSDT